MATKARTSPLDTVVVPVVAFAALAAGAVSGALRRSRPAGREARRREGASGHDERAAAGAAGGTEERGVKARLAALGRRWPWLGLVLRVQSRFGELHGNHLAGAISLQAFLSLFPLLLVLIAVAGFVSHNNLDLADQVVARLGLTGEAAGVIHDALATARESRRAASVIGLAGLAWSGLALVGALQYAYDQVWQVKERGMKDRLVGIGWLLGAVAVFLASAAVTTVLRFLPEPLKPILSPVGVLVALATNVALWLWTAKVLPNRDIGWRPLLPGAVVGGVGLEAMKLASVFYLPRLLSASAVYGPLGTVFAILAWLLLFGKLVVYSAVLNVVLWERRAGTRQVVVESPAAVGEGAEASRLGRVGGSHAA